MTPVRVVERSRLVARIIRRTALMYREGADSSLDRPAHIRAASGVGRVGRHLVVVQDDANFLALVDPNDGRAESVPLPAGPGGLRQFDDQRGNKKHKLDLESCITVGRGRDAMLVAFGSGSTRSRERVLVARGLDALAGRLDSAAPSVQIIEAPELYVALREARDFAGSELNIEGAVLIDERELRLFGRGNGAPRDGWLPINATCSFDWLDLWAYLGDRSLPLPGPHSITRYDLGTIDGVPLGFTDAIGWDRGAMFAAAAEASPDSVRDGRVSGSVLGVIPDQGSPTWMPLLDEGGVPFAGKVEGLAPGPGAGTVYAVADEDDPAKASELCVIRVDGS